MRVIIFEEETYWKHIQEVLKRVKVKQRDDRKWIDEPEAMELLGIKSKSEMWKMRSQGKIRYSQPSRKIIKYDRQSILKFLEDHVKENF